MLLNPKIFSFSAIKLMILQINMIIMIDLQSEL